ncbi:MAG: hypothetical protein JRM73_04580 [Nitrososphaerota archaeon]|nr:hypothetical protein [Nitrososphaerota archaeon]
MPGYKKPTFEDAQLLIKLVTLGFNEVNEEAMTWFERDFRSKTWADFKKTYPEGSPGMQYLGRIMAQYELAGVLVSHGLLNEDLFFDMSPIGFNWGKLEPIVEGARKEMPVLWENAVWLAERQKKWAKTVWKPNLAWKKEK